MPADLLREPFDIPIGAPIWRYMDISELVVLLETGRLHFSTLASFKDAEDGLAPLNLADVYRRVLKAISERASSSEAVRELTQWMAAEVDITDHDAQIEMETIAQVTSQRLAREIRGIDGRELARRCSIASCWHRARQETLSMWEVYAGRGAGVAVRSTVGSLIRALASADEEVHVGGVKYSDTATPSELFFAPALVKRRPFRHEREVRALVANWAWLLEGATARDLPCDPTVLIDRVVVSPLVPQHVGAATAAIARKYLPADVVVASSLAQHYRQSWADR